MFVRLLRWLQGYLLIQMTGNAPERFINLCRNKKLSLWNLKRTNGGYCCLIDMKSFWKLRPIIRKTKTKLHIQERKGLPFCLYHYRKRKLFFIGMILFAVIVYVLSLFIWDIDIEGEQTHTKESILKYLQTRQIHLGILKKNIHCKKIETMLREQYDDVGWVSAEMVGTRLKIKLLETDLPKQKIKKNPPHHLIASKNGKVISIITRKGTPLVKIGKRVKKGDLLVSGILNIVGDGEETIQKKAVAADADIFLQTCYHYLDEIPLNHTINCYTKKTKKAYAISFFRHCIQLYQPFRRPKQYDVIRKEEPVCIGKNFYLPIVWIQTEYKPYIKKHCTYGKTEVEQIAKKHLIRFLNKLKEKKVVVLKNNVKILVNGFYCIATGKITVEERAVQWKPIQKKEWKNIP